VPGPSQGEHRIWRSFSLIRSDPCCRLKEQQRDSIIGQRAVNDERIPVSGNSTRPIRKQRASCAGDSDRDILFLADDGRSGPVYEYRRQNAELAQGATRPQGSRRHMAMRPGEEDKVQNACPQSNLFTAGLEPAVCLQSPSSSGSSSFPGVIARSPGEFNDRSLNGLDRLVNCSIALTCS